MKEDRNGKKREERRKGRASELGEGSV